MVTLNASGGPSTTSTGTTQPLHQPGVIGRQAALPHAPGETAPVETLWVCTIRSDCTLGRIGHHPGRVDLLMVSTTRLPWDDGRMAGAHGVGHPGEDVCGRQGAGGVVDQDDGQAVRQRSQTLEDAVATLGTAADDARRHARRRHERSDGRARQPPVPGRRRYDEVCRVGALEGGRHGIPEPRAPGDLDEGLGHGRAEAAAGPGRNDDDPDARAPGSIG